MPNINNINLFGTTYDLNDIRINIEPYSSWTVLTIGNFVIAYGNRNVTFPNPIHLASGMYRSIDQLNLKGIMTQVYGGVVGYLYGYTTPTIVANGTNKYIAEVVLSYNSNFSGFDVTVPTVIFGVK